MVNKNPVKVTEASLTRQGGLQFKPKGRIWL
jgi:hypothetical protein